MSTRFTLTGTLYHQDEVTPAANTSILIKSDPYPDPTLKVYYTHGVRLKTDANGHFSQSLETRTGQYYTISSLAKTPVFKRIRFQAPAADTTKDITELTFYDPSFATPPAEAIMAGYASSAAASAASVNREGNGGVAGLDANGLPIRAVPLWRASTPVAAGATWQAPDGSLIKRTSAGTTRASFDATEQALWTAVLATSGTIENAGLSAVTAARNTTTKAGTFHTTDQMLSSLALIGVDTHDRGYFTNHAGGIFQSDNGMPTLGVLGTDRSANKGIPSGTRNDGPAQMVEFKGKLYLLTRDSTTGNSVIARTDRLDGDTAFTWTSPVLSMRAGATTTGWGCQMSADASYIYAGEYSDPTGGPVAYRSSDGTTWEQVWGPIATERHIHAIAPDPFNTGHVWMTVGDGGSYYIMRSTNYGASGSWVEMSPSGDHPYWQCVQISFTSTHIWFASDNRFSTAFIYERSSGTFKDATPNVHRHIPVPGAVSRIGSSKITDAVFNGTKVMTSATAAFQGSGAQFTPGSDIFREVHHPSLPTGRSWIAQVDSATQVQLYDASTASSSGNTVFFSDEQFHANAIWGTVDPATGIYYTLCFLGAGQRVGWFYARGPGEPLYLIDALGQVDFGLGLNRIIIWKGYAWSGVVRTKLRT